MSRDESRPRVRRPRKIGRSPLPPGPALDLREFIYGLYLESGCPTLDHLRTLVGRADDLPGAPGRDVVHSIIAGRKVPASLWDAVSVAVTLARTVNRDDDATRMTVRALWLKANRAPEPVSVPASVPVAEPASGHGGGAVDPAGILHCYTVATDAQAAIGRAIVDARTLIWFTATNFSYTVSLSVSELRDKLAAGVDVRFLVLNPTSPHVAPTARTRRVYGSCGTPRTPCRWRRSWRHTPTSCRDGVRARTDPDPRVTLVSRRPNRRPGPSHPRFRWSSGDCRTTGCSYRPLPGSAGRRSW